ncbi:MAG TPA: cobalamin-binding protein [Pirellulales bacterium]|nr:cobalamin-binding protein [Pirellulales bacterium]
MRIVSLVPSATEIICQLGLGDALCGVSHECDFPPRVRELPKVTRTLFSSGASSREIDALVRERLKTRYALYALDGPLLESLRPDLIVTQTLCDVCAVADDEVQAAVCKLPGAPRVINLAPRRLVDVFEGLRAVGEAAGVPGRAESEVARLQARVETVEQRTRDIANRPRVVMLEWIDPPFCAGHWSPELVRLAAGAELIGQEGRPSRTIEWEQIVLADPDVVFVACCGFDAERARQELPILAARPGFDALAAVRSGRVYWVDGSAYFNRPGPRLVDSLEILANALHPTIHPAPPTPARRWE